MAEKMTQDEIDQLMESITNASFIDDPTQILGSVSSERAAQFSKEFSRALKRYHSSMDLALSPEEYAEESRRLHYAAFTNWLYRHGFTDRQAYCQFINKEAKKRGYKWRLTFIGMADVPDNLLSLLG
jgi:hypothetical protein